MWRRRGDRGMDRWVFGDNLCELEISLGSILEHKSDDFKSKHEKIQANWLKPDIESVQQKFFIEYLKITSKVIS